MFKKKKIMEKEVSLPKEIETMSLNGKIDRLKEMLSIEHNGGQNIDSSLSEILLFFEKNYLKGKKKKFKLSSKVRNKIKKFHKTNKILVFYLTENKTLKATISQMFKGMVYVNNDWHSVPEQAIFRYENKYPAIILPEWDLQALIPDKLYEDAVKQKRIIAPQSIILRAIKLEENKMKAVGIFGGKAIMWLVIGGGILLYLIFG